MSNWAFWCCYPVPAADCGCPACFCSPASASSYLAYWQTPSNPTGLIASYEKEVVHNWCTTPQCSFHHNNYDYHIGLSVKRIGTLTVTKLPTGGLTSCGCYYQGSGTFQVYGYIDIIAPLSNCGTCPDFSKTVTFDQEVEGCLQIQCGGGIPCSTISGPAVMTHQLQLCDTQIINSIEIDEHNWQYPGVCTPAAVGLRLMGAVLQWTSTCDALDNLLAVDQSMVSQENTSTFICDNTFTSPNPCYSELLKNFSASTNGSFSVMFTQEYSLQDPAPIDCTYGIPATPLGQIPINPGNGFKGSLSPFQAKCQSMSANTTGCINTTMHLGVSPCYYA